jgi:predicted transcriptional regulator
MKLNDKKQFYSLEEARKYLNISQVELSKKTGIIQADISRIERGIANPSISILKRLAESMGMNLKIIFELK